MIAGMYLIAFAVLALLVFRESAIGFFKLALAYSSSVVITTCGFISSALVHLVRASVQIAFAVFTTIGWTSLINSWLFIHGLRRAFGKLINVSIVLFALRATMFLFWNIYCPTISGYITFGTTESNNSSLYELPSYTAPVYDYLSDLCLILQIAASYAIYLLFNNDVHRYALAHRAFLTHYYDQDCSRKYGRRKWRRLVRSNRNSMLEHYKIFGIGKLDYPFNFDAKLQVGEFDFENLRTYDLGYNNDHLKHNGPPNLIGVTWLNLIFTEVADTPQGARAFDCLPLKGLRDTLRTIRKLSIKYTGVSLLFWGLFIVSHAYRRTHNSDARRAAGEAETTLDFMTRNLIGWVRLQASVMLGFMVPYELYIKILCGNTDRYAHHPQPDDVDLQAGFVPDFGVSDLAKLLAKVDTIFVLRSTARAILVAGFVISALGTEVGILEAIESATSSPLFKKISSMKPTEIFTDVVGLINRIIEAIHTGRFSTLFTPDPVVADLSARSTWYLSVDVSDLGAGVPSPYADHPVFNHEFIRFGEGIIADLKNHLAIERAKFGNTSAKTWVDLLNKVELKVKSVTQHNDSLGMHEAPYSVLIPGQSAVGKSFLWVIWRKVGCAVYNLPCDDTYTYVVNDLHKHWDGFSSAMHTLLWDDASCTKLKEGDPGFLGSWLNVAGNNRYTPPAADLGNKGNMRAAFKMVFATSNTSTLQTDQVMVAPEAAMRRFNIMIVPEVKPEYMNDAGVVDGFQKYVEQHGRNPDNTADYNFWNFKLYKSVLNGPPRTEALRMAGGGEARVNYSTLTWRVELETDSLNDLNRYIANDMLAHRRKQADVLSSAARIQKGRFDFETGNINLADDVRLQAGRLRPPFGWTSIAIFLGTACFWHGLPIVVGLLPKIPLWVWFSTFVTAVHALLTADCVTSFLFNNLNREAIHEMTSRIVRALCQMAVGHLSQTPDAAEIVKFAQRSNTMINFINGKASWFGNLKARIENVATGITWKHVALATLLGLALHVQWASPFLQAGTTIPASDGQDNSPPANWGWFSTPKHGMTQTSCSVSDPEAVIKKVGENVFTLIIGHGHNRKFTNGLVLKSFSGGNLWVSTLHSFRMVYPNMLDKTHSDAGMQVEIPGANQIRGSKGGVIGTSMSFTLGPDRYICYPDLDLIFFTVQGQHRSDITSYLTTRNHASSTHQPAHMLSYDAPSGGELVRRLCDGLLFRNISITFDDSVRRPMRAFVGRWDRVTIPGSCGAPYIQCDGRKTCIVGIHQALQGDVSHAVHVPIELVNEAFAELTKADGGGVVLQGSATLSHIDSQFDRMLAAIDPTRMAGEMSINSLAEKSVFRQERCPEPDIDGCLNVVGSIRQSARPPNSKVLVHPLKGELLEATGLPEGPKVPPTKFTSERFYTAKRHFIRNVCAIPNTLAPSVVKTALFGFLTDAFSRLYHPSLRFVRPLTMKESINGVLDGPLAKYMSGVVMSTSAGFPYTKVKTTLLERDVPGDRVFKKEVYDQVERIRAALLSGKRPNASDVMFDAHFKDEPISQTKDAIAKIRVIIASPLALLLLFRQYILPLIAFISANRISFETCPSTVVQSYEWTLQRHFITGEDEVNPLPRIFFDGDYKGWDASLQKILVMCFFRVAFVIAYLSGNYSEDDLRVIVGLSLVICEAAVNFFGDIILFIAFNPSGQPGTAHTNGVVNSVIFRIAWILSGHPIQQFRHVVKLLVYGDDNWGSILSTHSRTFNKKVIASTVLPHGIFYTNADKSVEVTISSDVDKIDFLKRTWLWSDQLGAYLAPLNKSTLGGMCSILRTSTAATEFDQIRAGMQSLCDESFFHGEEFFRHITAAVKITLNNATGAEGSFEPPSYEQKVKNFVADSQYFRENATWILSSVRK
nr:MAG: polyprotein 1 [Picornavirales sp.]